MKKPVTESRYVEMFIYFSLFILFVEIFVFILLGEHHVDEGFYHYIAHISAQNELPYRDYIYVQTPLFPLVYGSIFKIIGTDHAIARGFTAFLGLIAILLAGKFANKSSGRRGVAVAMGLIVFQPFTIYYLTIIKLYALASLFIVAALLPLQNQKK